MKKYSILFCLLAFAYAKDVDPKLIQLQIEIAALKSLKQEKLELLESKEAQRWQNRYKQNAEIKLLEEMSKSFEEKYNRFANDLYRKQEEKIQNQDRTEELELKWIQLAKKQTALGLSIKQSSEKISEKISYDFPIGINDRTLLLNQVNSQIAENKIEMALERFFEERYYRYNLSQTQEVLTKTNIWNDVEKTVWQVRLGTIFLGDLDKENSQTQSLLRTGALQGKTFVWRSDLTDEFHTGLKDLVQSSVQNKSPAYVPIDVLQNRGIGLGYTKQNKLSTSKKISAWFAKGGLVMYPLLACALLALLLALERYWVYLRRSKKLAETRSQILPLLEEGKYREALAYCETQSTGLSKALAALISHRNGKRELAEKSIKESLIVEIPSLEKRLSLISALGASAPLLGLLGTVSGMITLFKVITDVGTNDARILAGGISEALVTTQTGLIIAIPILLIHGFLSEKLDAITADLQSTTIDGLNTVWPEGDDS